MLAFIIQSGYGLSNISRITKIPITNGTGTKADYEIYPMPNDLYVRIIFCDLLNKVISGFANDRCFTEGRFLDGQLTNPSGLLG